MFETEEVTEFVSNEGSEVEASLDPSAVDQNEAARGFRFAALDSWAAGTAPKELRRFDRADCAANDDRDFILRFIEVLPYPTRVPRVAVARFIRLWKLDQDLSALFIDHAIPSAIGDGYAEVREVGGGFTDGTVKSLALCLEEGVVWSYDKRSDLD